MHACYVYKQGFSPFSPICLSVCMCVYLVSWSFVSLISRSSDLEPEKIKEKGFVFFFFFPSTKVTSSKCPGTESENGGGRKGEQLFPGEKLSRCHALQLGFEEGSQSETLAK